MATIKPRSNARQKEAMSTPPTSTQHVGKILREAREARNLTIDAIANELMIRKVYLEALENGVYKEMPERVYSTGFVRSYAQFMDLDAGELSDQFKREAYGASSGYRVELTMPEPIIQTVVPSRSALIGATAAVVVIAIGIFLATRDSEPPAVSIPEAPMATDSAAPVDLSDEAAATQGFELAAPSATETVKESTSLPQAAETVPATRDIFLEATESAWTEIKDAKGAVLFTGMLKQGQKLPIPDQAGMTLSTGNAGGVRLVISGTAQSTIGAAGEIKRQIALDPLLATHDKTN